MLERFGEIILAVGPIPAGSGNRRDRERAAVTALLHGLHGYADAVIAHRPDGAPYIPDSDVHISISHSRRWAAVALSTGRRVGVDIEEPRPGQLERVAPRIMTPAELDAYEGRLLEAWTLKEAMYKLGDAEGAPGREFRLPVGDVGPSFRGLRFEVLFCGQPAATDCDAHLSLLAEIR